MATEGESSSETRPLVVEGVTVREAKKSPAFHEEIIAKITPLVKRAAEKALDWWEKEAWNHFHGMLAWPMLVHVSAIILLTWILTYLHITVLFVVPATILMMWQVWHYHVARIKRQIGAESRKEFLLLGLLPEKESVWWLNACIEKLWPVFLNDFISSKALPKLAPWFINTYKPPVVAAIDIVSVDMGDRPPRVSNVKVFREAGGDNHLELEMDLEIVSGDNMAVQVEAKVIGMSVIAWSAAVTGLQLAGRVRISVKFQKLLPFIERVTVTFPQPPTVSCAINVSAMGGLNAASLPLVASYVDYTLSTAVKSSLVWPNKLVVVDIVKMVSHLLGFEPVSNTSKMEGPMEKKLMKVKTSKSIKVPVANVQLEILEAENLVAADSTGTSDPFVRGTAGGSKFQSSVRSKTLNPRWHEIFDFPLPSWGPTAIVNLQVRDYDGVFSDDDIGSCQVDLSEFRGKGRSEKWIDLEGVSSGSLLVAVTVNEAAEGDDGAAPTAAGEAAAAEVKRSSSLAKLKSRKPSLRSSSSRKAAVAPPEGSGEVAEVKVEVIEARNLKAADKGGTSDPYVKGALGNKNFTTKVIWKTLNPKWGESFSLPVKEFLPGKNLLRFSLFDKDTYSKDDDLGLCEVDLSPLKHGERHDLWLKLDGVKCGELHVAITVLENDPPPPPAADVDAAGAEKGELPTIEEPEEEVEDKSGADVATGEAAKSAAESSSVPEEVEVQEEEGSKKEVVLSVAATEDPNLIVLSRAPSSAAYSKAAEVAKGVNHTTITSHVLVEVIEAQNLVAADVSGSSDPYVKGTIGPAKFCTKNIQKTLNPKWFEEFKVPIVAWDPKKTVLCLRVFDHDTFSASDLLGIAEINLNDFNDGLRHDMWVRLEGAKRGSIRLAVTAIFDGGNNLAAEVSEVVPGCIVERWDREFEIEKL